MLASGKNLAVEQFPSRFAGTEAFLTHLGTCRRVVRYDGVG